MSARLPSIADCADVPSTMPEGTRADRDFGVFALFGGAIVLWPAAWLLWAAGARVALWALQP